MSLFDPAPPAVKVALRALADEMLNEEPPPVGVQRHRVQFYERAGKRCGKTGEQMQKLHRDHSITVQELHREMRERRAEERRQEEITPEDLDEHGFAPSRGGVLSREGFAGLYGALR